MDGTHPCHGEVIAHLGKEPVERSGGHARHGLVSVPALVDCAPTTGSRQTRASELTEPYDLTRLKSLLRQVRGPSQLADDPAAYALEWRRIDDIEARWPSVLPNFVSRWLHRQGP